jgi:bifunctional non-homologous end joining protein LigD
MKSTTLLFSDLATGGSSHKEYRAHLLKQGNNYVVTFEYGRQGGTLIAGTKTPKPVSLEDAERIYEALVREKLSKGYVGAEASSKAAAKSVPNSAGRTKYPVELLDEITRAEAEALVKDSQYIMQVKLNGHRRQIEKTKDGFIGYNKKGEPVPIPAELVKSLNVMKLKTFFIDGELVGDRYYAFDILNANGKDLKTQPYRERWSILDSYAPGFVPDTWQSTAQKQAGLAMLLKNRAEGAVFKLCSATYRAGRGTGRKFKFVKTCTCRILALATKGHDNASLGLLKDGNWINVGGASMIGKDKNIRVGSLVEVRFLYFTGSRLYQPRIERIREDQTEKDCGFSQLKHAYQEGVEAA